MPRILILLVLIAAGCGGSKTTSTVPIEGPLSVEQWKQMDDMTLKYDPVTFDRLKKGDPKLEDEKAWDAFMRTVVFPQRKIDIPPRKYMN